MLYVHSLVSDLQQRTCDRYFVLDAVCEPISSNSEAHYRFPSDFFVKDRLCLLSEEHILIRMLSFHVLVCVCAYVLCLGLRLRLCTAFLVKGA